MSRLHVIAITAALAVAGCASTPAPPPLTPLEIQSMQTREYEHPKNVVFSSVMSVFQDVGYTIKNVDADAGFISAESTTKNTTEFSDVFWSAFLTGHAYSTSGKTLATASIEKIGERTRVRLNFVGVGTASGSYGQTSEHSEAILDAQVYQNAFERVENAIFVRSAN